MAELRAAKAWHITPPEWRALSEDDRAQMLAGEYFDATVEAYRQWWRDERREKKQKGGGYAALRDRFRAKG